MKTHILGFPRIGAQRELKFALERYWRSDLSEDVLNAEARRLCETHWQIQKTKGLSYVTTGDFSLYDHVLDTLQMFGMVPKRFASLEKDSLRRYFAMARGDQSTGIPAMEMSKWFNTNYHFIVPEIEKGMTLSLGKSVVIEQTREAHAKGYLPKAVLLGPMTLLALAKGTDEVSPWEKLDELLPLYEAVISELAKYCEWIQIDEPCLVGDLSCEAIANFPRVYDRLNQCANVKLMLTTYFDTLDDHLALAIASPCAGLHIDLIRGKYNLRQLLDQFPPEKVISLGVVDGRNIWRNDYAKSLRWIQEALMNRPATNVLIGSSCSLLHSPFDLDLETKLDPAIRTTMAFALQKCEEVVFLGGDPDLIVASAEFRENQGIIDAKSFAPGIYNRTVRDRVKSIRPSLMERDSVFAVRKEAQKYLGLPLFPTTTIGSFPQTPQIRNARKDYKHGALSAHDYQTFIQGEIQKNVKIQTDLGLDVFVHGEPERNDMVEYFGEQLNGFCFSANGWVQSYGSRCVKPPIIYGDVKRVAPMTVEWISYAQSLTDHPMKGMLTGPVTILCWSFVRDDLPREDVCKQIAFAIRDEVHDLEEAGIKIIQIDEAAISEGMPIKARDKEAYLKWAVEAFKLASCGVKDTTQIHTHMCYSEFNTIIEAIAQMDADSISIESSRSKMELLNIFKFFHYPNDIGPGVYDIHSPRIPSEDEIFELLTLALNRVPAEQLWVNPDCGLKTRKWEEVIPSLQNMVAATRKLRDTQK